MESVAMVVAIRMCGAFADNVIADLLEEKEA